MSRLIHLVSGQVMQNLLPALAMAELTEVIQVRSRREDFASLAAQFEEALRMAGQSVPVRTTVIEDAFPGRSESERAIRALLEGCPGALVNITGGTKLMSIGAYTAARALDYPTLYCDSTAGQFICAGESPLPRLRSFAETAGALDLRTVLAAHGKVWKAETPQENLLEFGRIAWELHQDHPEEVTAWIRSAVQTIPTDGPPRDRRVARNKSALRRFLQTPLPPPQSQAASAYVNAASDAGLLVSNSAGAITFSGEPKKSSVERTRNLLQGSWFEYTTARLMGLSGRYADIRVSLEPDAPGATDFGETDIVAIDTRNCRLCIVSCKLSLEHVKQLDHLAAIRDRAMRLGGSLAEATFCVASGPSNQGQLDSLKHRARLMQVRLVVGPEEVGKLADG